MSCRAACFAAHSVVSSAVCVCECAAVHFNVFARPWNGTNFGGSVVDGCAGGDVGGAPAGFAPATGGLAPPNTILPAVLFATGGDLPRLPLPRLPPPLAGDVPAALADGWAAAGTGMGMEEPGFPSY